MVKLAEPSDTSTGVANGLALRSLHERSLATPESCENHSRGHRYPEIQGFDSYDDSTGCRSTIAERLTLLTTALQRVDGEV